MKTDLIALQEKLANGAFLGFKLAEDAGTQAVGNTCDLKPGAAKLVLTKLGGTKTGLAKV